MTRGGGRSGVVLGLAAIASGAWWLGTLALLEGATGVDHGAGTQPSDTVLLGKAAAVLVPGTVGYAAALLVAVRRRGIRAMAEASGAAVLAGLYWCAVAFVLLGATAGDIRGDVVPDRAWQRDVAIITLVLAMALFALLLAAWRRRSRRLSAMVGAGARSVISRPLTGGEAALAQRIFGETLKVARVRIHNRRYLPWQASKVAMTPNGEVYFGAEDYKADFSRLKEDAAWLMHELTHAWQYQSGRSVKVRGLIEQTQELLGHSAYRYGRIDPSRAFASYRNEQQAAMVEDYFRLGQHMPLRYGSGSLEDYEAAIPFLRGR